MVDVTVVRDSCSRRHRGSKQLQSTSPRFETAAVDVTVVGDSCSRRHCGWGQLQSTSPWLGTATVNVTVLGDSSCSPRDGGCGLLEKHLDRVD